MSESRAEARASFISTLNVYQPLFLVTAVARAVDYFKRIPRAIDAPIDAPIDARSCTQSRYPKRKVGTRSASTGVNRPSTPGAARSRRTFIFRSQRTRSPAS